MVSSKPDRVLGTRKKLARSMLGAHSDAYSIRVQHAYLI